MSARDEITITGISAMGFHGVYDHEKRDGQPFVVDVTVRLPLQEAAETDNLVATVDYGDLANRVVDVIEAPSVDLVETLAGRIADIALSYPRVQSTTVVIHKPQAPIQVPFRDVTVTLHRERA